MHLAARNGHKGVVQHLVDSKANKEARDERQFTPLLHACERNREKVCALLLDSSCDKNAVDEVLYNKLYWETV